MLTKREQGWLGFRRAGLLAVAVACCAVGARAQAGWAATRLGAGGRDLNAVFFVDQKHGWIGGDGGQVWRTEDGGRSWTPLQLGNTDNVSDLFFRDKENGYLLAGNRVLTTDDGGATWREARRFADAEFGGAEPELYSVRFTDKKRGWIVGNLSRGNDIVDSLVLRTADGGQTWTRERVPARDELIHLDLDGDKRGWIVGDRGTILRTEDGGQTWARQRTGTNATLYHVEFLGDERGWAVGARGTILRTVDGGETWQAVVAPVARGTLLSVSFANADEGWIIGRGGVILRSSDGGRTWVQQESGTKQNLYALAFNKKRGVAVGGDGLVLQYER
ncbi:MAG TPA: YCF48-related protein [Pyrinomonadaceae bacterium]